MWGDTTPYDECELVEAIGGSSAVSFETLGKHSYFHQTYSFIRMMRHESLTASPKA